MDEFFKRILKIFENKLSEHSGVDDKSLANYKEEYLITFGLIKLLDSAQNYSKDNILSLPKDSDSKCYFNVAIYPNKKSLGFFNKSNFNLDKLVEDKVDFEKNLENYMSGFDDNLLIVFENLNTNFLFDLLKQNGLLFNVFFNLNNIDLSKKHVKNQKYLFKAFSEYLEIIKRFSIHDTEKIIYEDKIRSLLINYAMFESKIKGKNELNIYDPACGDGYYLYELINRIKQINGNCLINIYGDTYSNVDYAKILVKMIINNDNLENINKINKHELSEIDKKFDFIISDFQCFENDIRKNNSKLNIVDYFNLKLSKLLSAEGKLVMSLSHLTVFDLFEKLDLLLKDDLLESIIHINLLRDNPFYLIILNNNKDKKRVEKFILIDEEKFAMGNKISNPISHINYVFDDQLRLYHEFIEKDDNALIIKNEMFNHNFKFHDYKNAPKLRDLRWKFNNSRYNPQDLNEVSRFIEEIQNYNREFNPKSSKNKFLDIVQIGLVDEMITIRYTVPNFPENELKLMFPGEKTILQLQLIMELNNILDLEELREYNVCDGFVRIKEGEFELILDSE